MQAALVHGMVVLFLMPGLAVLMQAFFLMVLQAQVEVVLFYQVFSGAGIIPF